MASIHVIQGRQYRTSFERIYLKILRIKYYKFGFGTVTDYLNFEIRSGNIKRIAIEIFKTGKCLPWFSLSFLA